jgi:SAM-dependent methyltransferase
MNERARVRHPIFARMYAATSGKVEARGAALHRRELLAGLTGRVIEVGAGNGLNFAHYPPTVTLVVAVEPEPHLRVLAVESAAKAPVPVQVIGGLAEALPAQTASFDAGVASLVLCSVEQEAALGELFRVIRPGGELRFYEHVRATTPVLGPLLRLAEASFWPLIAGGCHPARDTETAIGQAGFVIEALREFRFSPSRPLPAIPHILGLARRPDPG